MLPQSLRKRRWKLVLITLAVLAIATTAKEFWNAWHSDLHESISWSADEARARGVLVTTLQFEPRELELDGKRVVFHEAWIEERALDSHFLVWFPHRDRLGGRHLCITLAAGDACFSDCYLALAPDTSGFATVTALGKPMLFVKDVDPDKVTAPIQALIQHRKLPTRATVTFTPG